MKSDSIILGISCFNHDASACLIKGDQIVGFAEEERFNYEKHTAKFPSKAIEYCLKKADIDVEEITDVAFYFNPKRCVTSYLIKNNPLAALYNFPIFQRKRFWYEGVWLLHFLSQTSSIHKFLKNKKAKIHFIDHHDCHVTYGLFAAPSNEGIVLSNDSMGEATSTLALSFDNKGNSKTLLKQEDPHSIGYLYGAVTEFLGYKRGDGEGKVMALASYGEEKEVDFFERKIALKKNGLFQIHSSLLLERSFQPKGQRLGKEFLDRFERIKPKNGVFEQPHFNLAFGLQRTTEKILKHQISFLSQFSDSIVLTGGVAQNSVANGLLVNDFPKIDFFVPPIPHDAGCSMGAALKVYWNIHRRYPKKVETAFLGPSYMDDEVIKLLDQNKISYQVVDDSISFLTQKLALGKVIALFRKEMEGGPRALCHRSIIADPSFPGIKEYLNSHVKHREWYRPYGGFIRTSDLREIFTYQNQNAFKGPYMSFVFPVKINWRSRIPSLVHIDGTTRVQTVDEDGDRFLLALLAAYKEKKSMPILINTSLNVRGLPICQSPNDALNAFYSSGIDYLLFNDKIIIGKE